MNWLTNQLAMARDYFDLRKQNVKRPPLLVLIVGGVLIVIIAFLQ